MRSKSISKKKLKGLVKNHSIKLIIIIFFLAGFILLFYKSFLSNLDMNIYRNSLFNYKVIYPKDADFVYLNDIATPNGNEPNFEIIKWASSEEKKEALNSNHIYSDEYKKSWKIWIGKPRIINLEDKSFNYFREECEQAQTKQGIKYYRCLTRTKDEPKLSNADQIYFISPQKTQKEDFVVMFHLVISDFDESIINWHEVDKIINGFKIIGDTTIYEFPDKELLFPNPDGMCFPIYNPKLKGYFKCDNGYKIIAANGTISFESYCDWGRGRTEAKLYWPECPYPSQNDIDASHTMVGACDSKNYCESAVRN